MGRLFGLDRLIASRRTRRWDDLHRTTLRWRLTYVRINASRRTDHTFGGGELIAERPAGILADGRGIRARVRWACGTRMFWAGRNGRLRGRDTDCRDRSQRDEKSASHAVVLLAPHPVRKRSAGVRVPE